MAKNVNLPPGFQLDQTPAPTGQATSQSIATPNLLQGFVIDQPQQNPSALDYYVKNPAIAAGKAYVNDAQDIVKSIPTTFAQAGQDIQNIGNAVTHPVDTVVNAVKSIPDMVMNHPLQTAAMALPNADAIMAGGQKVLNAAGNVASGIGQITQDAKNGVANMLLNPEFKQTSSDWDYNHDARRVMASMPGIIGDDFNSTKAAINAKMQETGQAIGDTIANSPASSVPIGLTKQDVTGHIDQIIGQLNQADPNGNAATIAKLLQKKLSLENTFNPDGTIKGPINFQNMTPQQAFDYKQLKLGNIKFTGNDSTDSQAVNAALQQSRQNLTTKMNTALPDLTPLNQDYGDLNAAMDAADRAAFKAQGQGIGKFQWADLVNTPINKWILNPQNRMQLAQFLYTAPKSDIQAMGKIIPNFNQTVNQSYGLPSPSSVSPVGSDIPPINPQLQGRQFSQGPIQPGSTQPIPMNGYVPPGIPKPLNMGSDIPPINNPQGMASSPTPGPGQSPGDSLYISPTARSASARYQSGSSSGATFNIGKQDIEDAITMGNHAAQNNVFQMEQASKGVMKFNDLKLLNQFVSDNESKVELISTDSDGNFYAHLKGK